MLRSKWSAVFYLVLVFISGALVGGFSYRLYSVNTVTATRRTDPDEWRKHYMDEFRSYVHIDADQEAQINQILDETRADFKQIRAREKKEYQASQDQNIAKIFSLLRPDQRPLYAKLRAIREARRRAGQPEVK